MHFIRLSKRTLILLKIANDPIGIGQTVVCVDIAEGQSSMKAQAPSLRLAMEISFSETLGMDFDFKGVTIQASLTLGISPTPPALDR